jgi:type VI secretion system FHA domain protein
MPLTLKITSRHRHILGADSIHVFNVHGGSIGRAPDNDWVLPDPDRYLSGHHAAVDYRSGAYYITDHSSNGVFVNDSDQPVGRGTALRLYDGDRLRMGDYQFDVNIVNVNLGATREKESEETMDQEIEITGSDFERAPGPEIETGELEIETGGLEIETTPSPGVGEEDGRADPAGPLKIKLLEEHAEELDSRPVSPADGPEDTIVHPEEMDDKAGGENVFSETGLLREDYLASEAGMGDRPTPEAPGGDLSEAVRLMLEATGLDPSRVPEGSEKELLVTYGHVMRATVEGVLAVLRTRSLIKGQFRLTQTTIQPAENNPLKFAPGVQDALEQMFYREGGEYMAPLQAVENAFGDVRAHQVAMVVAMKAAFRDLLERLEPDILEEKFDRGLKRSGGLLGGSNKSKYWDLYCDLFQVIAGHNDENFANVAGPKFAEAYDKEVYRLTGRGLPPRRMVDS